MSLTCSVIHSISHNHPCCPEDWLAWARKKAPHLFGRNEKNPALIAVILFFSAMSCSVYGLTGIRGEKSWKMQSRKDGGCHLQREALSKSVPRSSPCAVAGGGPSRVAGAEGVFTEDGQHLVRGPARFVTSWGICRALPPPWRLRALESPSELRWNPCSIQWGGGLWLHQASVSCLWNAPSHAVTPLACWKPSPGVASPVWRWLFFHC